MVPSLSAETLTSPQATIPSHGTATWDVYPIKSFPQLRAAYVTFWKLSTSVLSCWCPRLPNLHWLIPVKSTLTLQPLYHRPEGLPLTSNHLLPSSAHVLPKSSSFPDGSGLPRSALTANSECPSPPKTPEAVCCLEQTQTMIPSSLDGHI